MKEETKNKINLLESRFSEVRRIGELAKDISMELSKLDKYDKERSKLFTLKITGDYCYDNQRGSRSTNQEQYLTIPRELGERFLSELVAYKKRKLAEYEDKIDSIQVFSPSRIYN